MRVVFISNYLNHHQIPFSDAMYRELNGEYRFIQTEAMEQERLDMGWEIDEKKYPYLLKSYENMNEVMECINNSDLAIIGAASDEFVKERMRERKLVFRYSERIYKMGQWRAISPRGIYYMYKAHAHAKKRNMYMLCASAYLPCDLNIFHYYHNRMLKWGYFPELYKEDIKSLMFQKQKNQKIEIVWCGRFIVCKHPELVIGLARYLKENGQQNFVHITMIGTGELRSEYERKLKEENLENMVSIIGSLKPNEVRNQMNHANIFVATSDYNEGWGAVINEAMNSACTVIASHAMGAVPYLIKHGKNGLIYKSGNKKDFFKKVDWVIKNPQKAQVMGRKAYEMIMKVWNPDNAAKSIVEYVKVLLEGKEEKRFQEGPCSVAPIIQEWNMYSMLINGRKNV